MLLLKACPHCGGDLVLEREAQTAYLECLQCGHTLSRCEERALGVRCAPRGLEHVLASSKRQATARRVPAAVSSYERM